MNTEYGLHRDGSGILQNLRSYLNGIAPADTLVFGTVVDMQAATPAENSIIQTKGYYTSGDEGAALYHVVDPSNYVGTPDEQCDFTLGNGLIAKIIIADNVVFTPSCGLIAQDSEVNQQALYNNILNYAKSNKLDIKFGSGNYYLEKIIVSQAVSHIGSNKGNTSLNAVEISPEPANPYGFVELDEDRVDNSSLINLRLVGRGAGNGNTEQWAIYAQARRVSGSDSGWWFSDIDVWAEEFKNSVWLRGGANGSLDPIQFINFKGSRFRRLPGGVSYRCTGQVNQVEGSNNLLACNPFSDKTGTSIEMGRDPEASPTDSRRPQGHNYSLMSIQSSNLGCEFNGCEGINFDTPYLEEVNRCFRAYGDADNRGSFGVTMRNPRFAAVGFGQTYVVTNITQGNPGVVTFVDQVTLPDLLEDDGMLINGVVGMTEVNGNRYRMKAVTSTTFELYTAEGLPVDTTGFSPYTSGGTFNNGYLTNGVGFSDIEVKNPLFVGNTVPTSTWFDFTTGNYGVRTDGIVSTTVAAAELSGRSYGQTRAFNNQSTINVGNRKSIRIGTSSGVMENINSSLNVGETITFQVVNSGIGSNVEINENGNILIDGATTANYTPGQFFTATVVDDNSSAIKYLVKG